VAITLERLNEDIGVCLCNVGEALEAQGAFEEAAVIYQGFTDTHASTVEHRATAQANCALAWKRAGEYEVSEEASVEALYLQSRIKPLDFADVSTLRALSNLINMYFEWVRKDIRPGEDADETRWVDSLFLALLYIAGFQPPSVALSEYILSEWGPLFVILLAPRFRTKKRANQAIIAACSSSSVSIFRARILSCKDPEMVYFTNTESIQLEKDFKDEKTTRKLARENHFGPRCCGGCHRQEEHIPFQRCSCKQVSYCGVQCQISHWKMHKLTCTHYTKTKKADKSKK